MRKFSGLISLLFWLFHEVLIAFEEGPCAALVILRDDDVRVAPRRDRRDVVHLVVSLPLDLVKVLLLPHEMLLHKRHIRFLLL